MAVGGWRGTEAVRRVRAVNRGAGAMSPREKPSLEELQRDLLLRTRELHRALIALEGSIEARPPNAPKEGAVAVNKGLPKLRRAAYNARAASVASSAPVSREESARRPNVRPEADDRRRGRHRGGGAVRRGIHAAKAEAEPTAVRASDAVSPEAEGDPGAEAGNGWLTFLSATSWRYRTAL
jgi:hypothetical protein